MRIGITGGTGFIGQCLLRDFADSHEFVAFTVNPQREGLFQHENVRYVAIQRTGDKGCSFDSNAASALESCDAAANLGFSRPFSFGTDCFENYVPSILASNRFLEACIEAGITNIAHISTRSVYSKTFVKPHVEDEAIEPFSYYGAAKASAETTASVLNVGGKAHIKVLRLAQIIGANETQGVVSASIRNAKAGKPLQVWGGGGEIAREYLYVRDATAAIMASLQKPEAQGVFNIGTGQMTTVADLMQMIAVISEERGNHVKIEHYPEKHVEPMNACMDVAKAANVFGWRSSWTIEQALRAIYDDADSLY